jgi:small subunit ribosomal protein S2
MMDFRKLVEAGVHFGHKKARWNPKMAPYIWGSRDNIHLIDVSKTARQLEQAAKFLESVAAEGKTILWVGTKKAAQKTIAEAAEHLDEPYVTHRWIGGTLTNHSQVKKSITKLLHLEDVLKKADGSHYTKKEIVTLQKNAERLEKNVGSIRDFKWPVGAVVLVDVKKEQTALREAASINVPVVGLVDTNSNPSLVDYVIPTNDDAPKAIALIVNYLADAVERGQKKVSEKPKEEMKFVQKIEEPAEEVAPLKEEDDEEIESKKTTKKAIAAKKTVIKSTAKKTALK